MNFQILIFMGVMQRGVTPYLTSLHENKKVNDLHNSVLLSQKPNLP
jgi:hypothetical protein